MAPMKTNENIKARRLFILAVTVGIAAAAFPAASFQTQATLWSVFDGPSKVCEQSNNPVFTESTAPGSGNPPWTWDVTNIRGFAGSADFSFVRLNADGTQASLDWTAIENTDWQKSGGCEGLFDLRLFNNVDADITYPDFQVSLRCLDLNGYTVFQGQTGGGSGLPVSDPHTYTFSIPAFSAELPGDLSMAMNNVGAVTEASGTIAGTEEGTFTVRIQDGSRPYSEVSGIPLSLRRLGTSGYTVFQGQTGGGSGLPVSDSHTYTFSVPAFSAELPGDLSMAMNNRGVVISVDSVSAAWNENGTFTVRIQDGMRPYSEITGFPLSLRRIIPLPLTIPDNGNAGSINLQVGSDVGPWDWSDYEDGLANSVLTAPDSLESSTLTISWEAGALETDETGTGTVTIQRSDGSAPASTVALETVVTEAPPMPVSCWPILAAILAIVAVVLIMSRKYRTVA